MFNTAYIIGLYCLVVALSARQSQANETFQPARYGRLDQPLIQRIPAGLSSTVACLDVTHGSLQPTSLTVNRA